MQKVTFISATPYLTLSFKELSSSIQFVEHYHITEDPHRIQLLRAYAKSNPVTIAEAGEAELEDLIKRYNEAEDNLIREAEEKEKARAEEKAQRKAQHDFYSTLRMTDGVTGR